MGADSGDTFVYFVESGWSQCDRKNDINDAYKHAVYYNLASKQFDLVNDRNCLVGKLERLLRNRECTAGPRDYSYPFSRNGYNS